MTDQHVIDQFQIQVIDAARQIGKRILRLQVQEDTYIPELEIAVYQ